MNYSEFLFSQLFMCHLDKLKFDVDGYDIVFDNVLHHYNLYIDSPFDNPNKGEYECMVDYLNTLTLDKI